MAGDASALVVELHERGYLAEQIVAVTGLSSSAVTAALKGRVEGRHEETVFHLRVAGLRQQGLTQVEIAAHLACDVSVVRGALRIIRECELALPEREGPAGSEIDPRLVPKFRALHPLSSLLPTISTAFTGTTPPPSATS